MKTSPDQSIRAFRFDTATKKLQVLDQTLLPKTFKYVEVSDSRQGHSVIKNMMVRGAPCIAAVGCLSIIAELNQPQSLNDKSLSIDDLVQSLRAKSSYLITSRPTAVNLRNSLDKLVEFAELSKASSGSTLKLIESLTKFCQDAIVGGEALNKRLGDFGAERLLGSGDRLGGIAVLTHCNTGALATVGYGTALGVIRSLHLKGQLKHAYCTETRPYNQGSRLTAWELVQEKIPATLIADSMVAYLMATREIDAVVVGADCVASNGDTANKIGTLQLAVVAKHYSVPFYVAAPTQSFDLTIDNQSGIEIEQRPAGELRRLGDIVLAPDEINVWNPCFDVTPANLITGIITELGVCKPAEIKEFMTRDGEGKLEKAGSIYALF